MKTKPFFLALIGLLFLGLALEPSRGAVAVSIGIAPPAIPVYEQPLCPAPGYIWTPGYWAYGPYGYYWVPGVWILPPRPGFLWTPGYWGFRGGRYVFTDGYWGPTIGFYGGINYGYGYYGHGYYGGRWSGNTFVYNTAVTRVSPAIKTTYVDREALKYQGGNRSGFNGRGGVQAKPSAREQAAAKAEHVRPTTAQRSRIEAAGKDPALRAKNNNGKPPRQAVRAFQGKHGQGRPTASNPNARAEKGSRHAEATNATNRSQAIQRSGIEKKRANVGHPRNAQLQGAAPSNRKVHRAPAPARMQGVKKGQASHNAGRHGAAQGQENGKKKKRGKEKRGPE